MNRLTFVAAVIATVSGFLITQNASAAYRAYVVNGSGVCQGAQSSDDDKLRKRPTAIANEGTTNAFVSCSIMLDANASVMNSALAVNNNTNTDIQVTCTHVAGYTVLYVGAVQPITTTITKLVPRKSSAWFSWYPESSEQHIDPVNWSCNLPPGTEISALIVDANDPNS